MSNSNTDTAAVTKITGAPGAGKTFKLKQALKAAWAKGLEIDQFWWLSFTNAGTRDAGAEIAQVYDGANDPEDRARTLHSLALSLMIRRGEIDMSDRSSDMPGPIIQHGGHDNDSVDPYCEFCDRRGMRYDPDAADPRKLLAGEETTKKPGNKLFAINDYLRQTCKAPEKHREAPQEIEMPASAVVSRLEEWRDYKQNEFPYQLFEHGDYVRAAADAGLVPEDVSVLFIDEFQDFAPLEYRLFKMWRDTAALDEIYVAGDPNQSIYSFRGGTPHYFKRTPAETAIELSDSYRCPERIADLGNAVLSSHPDTDPRGFAGRDTGGHVDDIPARGKFDLRDEVRAAYARHDDATDPVMILTRTNSQLRKLTRALRAVGIPFEMLGSGGGVWRGELAELLTVLTGWKNKRERYVRDRVRTLLEKMPGNRQQRLGAVKGDTVKRGQLYEAISGLSFAIPEVSEIVPKLTLAKWKRDVLVNALDAPGDMTPADVRVGTIHAAKGLEARAVFLSTTTTEQIQQEYHRDPDAAAEEHRVYYVGVTRASAELKLLDSFFRGDTATPIEQARHHQIAQQ